jgi:hypothetical protein
MRKAARMGVHVVVGPGAQCRTRNPSLVRLHLLPQLIEKHCDLIHNFPHLSFASLYGFLTNLGNHFITVDA